MPEQGGDGLQPHAAVDGLGGQRVAQPVRMHAGNPGRVSDPAHDAADDVPVQRAAVVGDQPLAAADVLEVGGGPGGEQLHDRFATGTIRWWPPLPSTTASRRSATCTSANRSPSTSHRRSPASSIASTIARSRCVRSAPTSRSASPGDKIRGSVRGTRTSGAVRDRRDPPSRRVSRPRGTGLTPTGVSPRATR